jgi:hypothetical protein
MLDVNLYIALLRQDNSFMLETFLMGYKYTGRIFSVWTRSMTLRLTTAGVRRIWIVPMNQHARWPICLEWREIINLWTTWWYYVMLLSEQCGSSWFVSSRQQLSAPLAICSQLQLVSSVVSHGVAYFRAVCLPICHPCEIRICYEVLAKISK